MAQITSTIRERRSAFFGHVTRRLNNRIFAYFLRKKTTGAWFTEVERDLQEVEIINGYIQRRDLVKKKPAAQHE